MLLWHLWHLPPSLALGCSPGSRQAGHHVPLLLWVSPELARGKCSLSLDMRGSRVGGVEQLPGSCLLPAQLWVTLPTGGPCQPGVSRPQAQERLQAGVLSGRGDGQQAGGTVWSQEAWLWLWPRHPKAVWLFPWAALRSSPRDSWGCPAQTHLSPATASRPCHREGALGFSPRLAVSVQPVGLEGSELWVLEGVSPTCSWSEVSRGCWRSQSL